MKTIVLAILALFIVTVAFAGETTVTFSNPTVVNGQKLAPGQYTIRYDIKGKTADVKISQSNRTVVTTTATVAENQEKAPYDSVVRENKGDGTSALKEIQMGNKKQVIRFEDSGTAVGK